MAFRSSHGEISGVLEFFSRESQEPDRLLLEMMTGVGNQIGQFIERKRVEAERELIVQREQRARGEAEAAMERVRCVQRVTDVALAHLTMDELLVILLECRAIGAYGGDLLLRATARLVAWQPKDWNRNLKVVVLIPVGAVLRPRGS